MSTTQTYNTLAELHRVEESGKRGDMKNRRAFERHVIREQAYLYPMVRAGQAVTPEEVSLRDVGRGGLGFVCSKPLEVNTIWHIELTRGNQVVGQLDIKVCHCREISEGCYLVGTQAVISGGIMTMLGVDPAAVEAESNGSSDGDAFDSGDDVAA